METGVIGQLSHHVLKHAVVELREDEEDVTTLDQCTKVKIVKVMTYLKCPAIHNDVQGTHLTATGGGGVIGVDVSTSVAISSGIELVMILHPCSVVKCVKATLWKRGSVTLDSALKIRRSYQSMAIGVRGVDSLNVPVHVEVGEEKDIEIATIHSRETGVTNVKEMQLKNNHAQQTDVLPTGKFTFHRCDHQQTGIGANGQHGVDAHEVVTVDVEYEQESVTVLDHTVAVIVLVLLIKRRCATNKGVLQRATNIHREAVSINQPKNQKQLPEKLRHPARSV